MRNLTRRFLILCILATTTSCAPQIQAPCHHFEATWYIVRDGAKKTSIMYLVVLNKSSETQSVEKIILNRFIKNSQETGWELRHNMDVEPGQVISRPITTVNFVSIPKDNTEKWECRVPQSVEVFTKDGKSEFAELPGGMPSALPDSWQECP